MVVALAAALRDLGGHLEVREPLERTAARLDACRTSLGPVPAQADILDDGVPQVLATQPGLCIVYKPSGWVVNVNSDTAAGLGMGQQVDGAVSSTRPRHTLLCVCFFYGWSPPNGFPLGFLQNQTTIWVPHTASNTALSPRWQGGEDTWEGDQAAPKLTSWLSSLAPWSPISGEASAQHGILHRLDLETSGPLLCATSYGGYIAALLQFALRRVSKAFRATRPKRRTRLAVPVEHPELAAAQEYVCLCKGWFPREAGDGSAGQSGMFIADAQAQCLDTPLLYGVHQALSPGEA
ncbi:unnamed protein product [Effrenium voratum]|nr:unnamed protein product [Effrenium voratum]